VKPLPETASKQPLMDYSKIAPAPRQRRVKTTNCLR
jgi:hypothetical protein